MEPIHMPTYHEIQELRKALSNMNLEHWLHDEVFTLTWWFLLFSSIAPFMIWWKLVDRERFNEIFSFGLLCGIFATILDVMGVDLVLWGYPDKLLSMIPPLFPADLCVIPVSAMLMYQKFSRWRSFFYATVVWSFVLSFVIEPIFVHFNMFALHNWKHIYSFFAFIAFLLLSRFIFSRIQKNIN